MVKVKICGITSYEDGHKACDLGADLLGFIFVQGTPRFIDPEKARDIVFELKSRHAETGFTGLFRDEGISNVSRITAFAGLDLVQLHGDEPPEYCSELKRTMKEKYDKEVLILKVFKVMEDIKNINGIPPSGYHDADYFVFDTYSPDKYGGTGQRYDWSIVAGVKSGLTRPFFMAGGLGPGNVGKCVRTVRPYGVDVSSGTELRPGKKDHDLLKEFINNAKRS